MRSSLALEILVRETRDDLVSSWSSCLSAASTMKGSRSVKRSSRSTTSTKKLAFSRSDGSDCQCLRTSAKRSSLAVLRLGIGALYGVSLAHLARNGQNASPALARGANIIPPRDQTEALVASSDWTPAGLSAVAVHPIRRWHPQSTVVAM